MLTFQELISTPFFSEASIIGGWQGKEKNFSHLRDDFTNLKHPSLVLLHWDENQLEKMDEHLSNPNVNGVIMYGSNYIPCSASMIEQINKFQKPVLHINETNIHTIKKQIEDMFVLKSLGHFHYVWNGMTDYWIQFIHDHSLQKMFKRLRLFIHEDLFLLSKDFSPVDGDEKELPPNERRTIRTLYLQEKKRTESWYMLQYEQDVYLLFPLQMADETYGYIVLKERPGMMIDTCIEIVSRAIPAIISALKTEKAILSTHKEYKENFLYNLLFNNIESEQSLIQLGKQWDLDFTKPAQLMVLKLESKENEPIKKLNLNYLWESFVLLPHHIF